MIKVREATLKDLDKIIELMEKFLREHFGNLIKKNSRNKEYFALKSNAFDMVGEFVKNIIKGDKGTIHIVEEKGILIAYILLEIKQDVPIYVIEEFGYIAGLYVRKQYRGNKISSKLYKEAYKWFKKHGIKHITIGVNPENKRAHLIYKKWGFFDFRIEMRNQI